MDTRSSQRVLPAWGQLQTTEAELSVHLGHIPALLHPCQGLGKACDTDLIPCEVPLPQHISSICSPSAPVTLCGFPLNWG